MKRFIQVLTALLFPLMAAAHPIHVSVCEVVHDRDAERLEITLKIFWDDFEDVLEDRTGEVIRLGAEGEHPDTEKFIESYLKEKLLLEVNGRPVELEFHGREIEDVAIWCYLSVPDIREVSMFKVRNEVMLHWFRDQVNVVHLDCNDKMNSTFLARGREEDRFVFK